MRNDITFKDIIDEPSLLRLFTQEEIFNRFSVFSLIRENNDCKNHIDLNNERFSSVDRIKLLDINEAFWLGFSIYNQNKIKKELIESFETFLIFKEMVDNGNIDFQFFDKTAYQEACDFWMRERAHNFEIEEIRKNHNLLKYFTDDVIYEYFGYANLLEKNIMCAEFLNFGYSELKSMDIIDILKVEASLWNHIPFHWHARLFDDLIHHRDLFDAVLKMIEKNGEIMLYWNESDYDKVLKHWNAVDLKGMVGWK